MGKVWFFLGLACASKKQKKGGVFKAPPLHKLSIMESKRHPL